MADIELVIKIDEEDYERCKKRFQMRLFVMGDAIANGTPLPKTGRWITTRTFMHDGEYYCDRCKCDAPNNEKWDYCPNCGAKMTESEEADG